VLKRKLLLADDSITIQKVVNLTFADEGIDVITVGDGNAAMAKIAEMAPDVILADVHMPGLSGYQVCEMVRSNEATKGLPVVLLVGSFEPFDENEAARVGANAFMTKPFQSIRQLVSQVSDLMQTSAPASGPVTEEAGVATSEYVAPEEDIDKTIPAHAPDTTDIDRLYAQSVGGMRSEAAAESGPATYVDAGMDDEMIETVHAAGDDAADEERSEGFYQEPTAEYQQPADEYQIETAGDHQPVAEYEQPREQYQQPIVEFEQPTEQQPVVEFEQPTEQQPIVEFEQPTQEQYQFPVDEYREPTVEYHEPPAAYEQPAESVFQEAVPTVASPFDAPAEETPPLSSRHLKLLLRIPRRRLLKTLRPRRPTSSTSMRLTFWSCRRWRVASRSSLRRSRDLMAASRS
jgi:CheY-like chemotaxis protein